MTREDVEVIDDLTVYDGIFRVRRYRLRHRRFDGGWTGVLTREVFERGLAVAVLPYDPVRDIVVMIEQFRVGAFAAGRPAWMTEIVAGIVEAGEAEEAVAHRELAEESGLTALDLRPIATFMPSPGALVESVSVYCARVDSTHAGGLHGVADEGEDIRVRRVPAAEALAELDAGHVDNAITLVALQWLARHRERLRADWSDSG